MLVSFTLIYTHCQLHVHLTLCLRRVPVLREALVGKLYSRISSRIFGLGGGGGGEGEGWRTVKRAKISTVPCPINSSAQAELLALVNYNRK